MCVCVCVCVRTLLVHSTGPVIERAFEDCGGKTRLGPSIPLSSICSEVSLHLAMPQFLHF